jgi:hypothetical protein
MQTLRAALDRVRRAVIAELDGVSDEDARRSPSPHVEDGAEAVPSLLAVVRRLTLAEITWFSRVWAGFDVTRPSSEVAPGDTVAKVVAGYRGAIAASNAVLLTAADLDQTTARPGDAPEPVSRRWVLVHLVEETARLAGVAAVVRPLVIRQMTTATGLPVRSPGVIA